ncbi:F0F1 ATP synthase subunit B family protein [Lyngbya confervoides]|uniref:ATP synthase subunit b n=1 Tax=Lyngbya confervoides BDU141951 TaxID=1574623 RepID=A0ABD4T8L9_9CYAN|nr:ATP F0F1 synthase subunit B [Lyngbya confervoides]MCM1984941.1 hypothetical protein [Lyngbya confervoides BDU141951]
MLIDPITTFAQIVNFVVLVALLKRFLYAPILQAMQKREQAIHGQLQAAAQDQAIAQAEASRYRQLQQEFADQQASLEHHAQLEAEAYRQSLLREARQEVEVRKGRWVSALQREQRSVLKSLRQQLGLQVMHTVRQILQDLAQAHLEAQMVNVFTERLRQLPSEERDRLQRVLDQPHPPVVYSTFAIAPDQQAQIAEALFSQVPALQEVQTSLQFKQQSQCLCGLELVLPGYKLAWTVDAYLDHLEETIAQLLDQQDLSLPLTDASASTHEWSS